jgi:putative flavoprotein involved in K+ transport
MAKRTCCRVERYEAVVLGAGQAGLAAAYHLARDDRDFLVIDAAARVGDSWRTRWDSLRLFTPAAYDGLPGMPFPAPRWHLPTKDEIADYLEEYALAFDLPVRLRTPVEGVAREGGVWVVRTVRGRIEAESIVVATGALQAPHVPHMARTLDPSVVQLHSSAYRNPAQLPAGDVLVVGAGNSGAQIAIELSLAGRRVWLSGRDVGSIPRAILGRDVYWWIWRTVLERPARSALGRRAGRSMMLGGDPLVGIAPRDLARPGLERVGRTVDVLGGRPVLDDGRHLDIAAVVWCTGFRPDFRWIDAPGFGPAGLPRHECGVATEAPGLYFLGLRFQHRLNSHLVGGVGRDAEHVAAHLGRYVDARQAVRDARAAKLPAAGSEPVHA